ncbi:MAG: GNAT family N-acetyltransferase [Candidatus Thorarchaeota archaeon]
MKLMTQKMHEIDVDAHAKLIYDARQNSPLRNSERTIDGIKESLGQLIEQGESHAMIVAQDEDSNALLGQLLMWLEWGEMAISHPWQPIIHPEANQEEVAVALIEHSKTLIKTKNKTRVETWLEIKTDNEEAMSSIFIPWYKKSGFILKAEEYYMNTPYSRLNELDYSIPAGVDVVSMDEVTNEEIMGSVLETFRQGSDKWFISMTESQQEGSARAWFKRDETFDTDSSIVFIENGKIIGYNVMRIEEGLVEVGPIGVLPAHRGRGLGRALLLESTRRLNSKNPETVWLTVSTENTSACNLYSSLGFDNKYRILIYTWMP